MYAMVTEINSAAALALNYAEVLSARSYDVDDITVISILTAPIYLKSERDELRASMQAEISEALGREVVVTYDTEVYRKTRGEMDDNEKRALLELARAR